MKQILRNIFRKQILQKKKLRINFKQFSKKKFIGSIG